jgi:hypothetical protein
MLMMMTCDDDEDEDDDDDTRPGPFIRFIRSPPYKSEDSEVYSADLK